MVNEPLVFELLKFDCIYYWIETAIDFLHSVLACNSTLHTFSVNVLKPIDKFFVLVSKRCLPASSPSESPKPVRVL